jgi:hypothetical protein
MAVEDSLLETIVAAGADAVGVVCAAGGEAALLPIDDIRGSRSLSGGRLHPDHTQANDEESNCKVDKTSGHFHGGQPRFHERTMRLFACAINTQEII